MKLSSLSDLSVDCSYAVMKISVDISMKRFGFALQIKMVRVYNFLSWGESHWKPTAKSPLTAA